MMINGRVIAALGVAVTMLASAGAAPTAELPQASKKMLSDLKVDAQLLAGMDEELKVPAAWTKGAKKEGQLKIIGTWDAKQFKKFSAPFNERYPFIRIDYVRAGRRDRSVKPLMALNQGRYLTDVISGIGGSYYAYREANGLMSLKDLPNLKRIDPGLQDPDGYWVGHQLGYWCMAYNTNLVKAKDLPRTWDDLLTNTRWHKGKIGMGNRPNLWFLQLWAERGADWGKPYVDQLFAKVKPQLRKEGMNALVSLVIAGEFHVSLPSAMYRVSQYASKKAPVSWHCPEPVPATVQSLAALRGNPHANATRIYVNWLLSKEGQLAQFYGNNAPSVRKELQTREFMVFADQIMGRKVAFRRPAQLRNEWPRLLKYWRGAWDQSSGTVQKIVDIKLSASKRGGRRLQFKVGGATHTVKISRSRTAVFIGGKRASRSKLKAGMACKVTYPGDKGEAREVSCR